jgi:hypothetical protein
MGQQSAGKLMLKLREGADVCADICSDLQCKFVVKFPSGKLKRR